MVLPLCGVLLHVHQQQPHDDLRGADWLAGSGERIPPCCAFGVAFQAACFTVGGLPREVPLRSRVFSVHHPGGDPAHYATGRFIGLADTSLEGLDQILRDALSVNWELGVTEPGSSGGGCFTIGTWWA